MAFTLAAVACGGVADPIRGGDGRVATISGALTGVAVPANARVALVYRNVTSTGSVEVGSDVPVVNGKFTMNLSAPAADYFSAVDGSMSNVSPSTPIARPVPEDAPPPAPSSGGSSPSGGGGAFGAATKLAPRDLVGGQITEQMTAALAGFVVYADTNGNGKLDLEGPYASSPDQILGGNRELMLVYLKDGGSLDYEKMRDKSGVLPAAGFNLAWTEGRWLPLNVVELKLSSNAQLPGPVCDSYISASGNVSSGTDVAAPDAPTTNGGGSTGGSGSGYSGYPSPTDPALHCSPDGRSFSYGGATGCPPIAPPPVGLCGGDMYGPIGCADIGYGSALSPDQPVPADWPCPIALDGGAYDGGAYDGGAADGGAYDGGAADGG